MFHIRTLLAHLKEASRLDRYLQMFKGFEAQAEPEIKWAIDVFEKDDRIIWFLKNLQKAIKDNNKQAQKDIEEFKEYWEHHFSGMLKTTKEISSWFKDKLKLDKTLNIKDLLKEMKEVEAKAVEYKPEKDRLVAMPDTAKIFIQITPDLAWWDLGKQFDDDEGSAMGHCGNNSYMKKAEDTLLSLREKVSKGKETYYKPHLTFVLNKGYLGEMRGYANDYINPRYHKYIVELLKDKRIKHVVGSQFKDHTNFKFLNLSKAEQEEVLKVNPNIDLFQSHEKLKKAIPSEDMPQHHKYYVEDLQDVIGICEHILGGRMPISEADFVLVFKRSKSLDTNITLSSYIAENLKDEKNVMAMLEKMLEQVDYDPDAISGDAFFILLEKIKDQKYLKQLCTNLGYSPHKEDVYQKIENPFDDYNFIANNCELDSVYKDVKYYGGEIPLELAEKIMQKGDREDYAHIFMKYEKLSPKLINLLLPYTTHPDEKEALYDRIPNKKQFLMTNNNLYVLQNADLSGDDLIELFNANVGLQRDIIYKMKYDPEDLMRLYKSIENKSGYSEELDTIIKYLPQENRIDLLKTSKNSLPIIDRIHDWTDDTLKEVLLTNNDDHAASELHKIAENYNIFEDEDFCKKLVLKGKNRLLQYYAIDHIEDRPFLKRIMYGGSEFIASGAFHTYFGYSSDPSITKEVKAKDIPEIQDLIKNTKSKKFVTQLQKLIQPEGK